jgi:D-proline reductase (dithiol) PrdB
MAKFSDLTFKYRLFMKTYKYRSYDWGPGARMTQPLSESRLAVVTTAAVYSPDQPPFDESIKGGDVSYKNLALPLDRLRELENEGVIGAINARHFSFMGSVTAPGRLTSKTAPEVAGLLQEDRVDAVLLTPV